MLIQTVNKILSVLTIGSQIFIFLGFIQYLFFRKLIGNPLIRSFSKNGLFFALIIAVVATAGSLFYSEIAGFEPCKLCWFQRIFMYPLVILLGLACIKKDLKFTLYPSALAGIGASISLYHNFIYSGIITDGNSSIFQCQPFGLGVSCAKNYVLEFGYITIPLMALTAFLLIILLLNAQRIYNNSIKKL
jgi:disulfide bond formation protein DsbB